MELSEAAMEREIARLQAEMSQAVSTGFTSSEDEAEPAEANGAGVSSDSSDSSDESSSDDDKVFQTPALNRQHHWPASSSHKQKAKRKQKPKSKPRPKQKKVQAKKEKKKVKQASSSGKKRANPKEAAALEEEISRINSLIHTEYHLLAEPELDREIARVEAEIRELESSRSPPSKRQRGGIKPKPRPRNAEGVELYCLCLQPWTPQACMIGCEGCENWYHWQCVGMTQVEVGLISKYYCKLCEKQSRGKLKTELKSQQSFKAEVSSGAVAMDATAVERQMAAIAAALEKEMDMSDDESSSEEEDRRDQVLLARVRALMNKHHFNEDLVANMSQISGGGDVVRDWLRNKPVTRLFDQERKMRRWVGMLTGEAMPTPKPKKKKRKKPAPTPSSPRPSAKKQAAKRPSGSNGGSKGAGGKEGPTEANVDQCTACGLRGDLICCDGCTNAYHGRCCLPRIRPGHLPDGEWFCPTCKRDHHKSSRR